MFLPCEYVSSVSLIPPAMSPFFLTFFPPYSLLLVELSIYTYIYINNIIYIYISQKSALLGANSLRA